MIGALSGVRVVDLAGGVAAGYAGRLLADLGADVLLIEPPEGDPCRHLGPFPDEQPDPERSGLFLSLHAGKRSVVADPARPEDSALVRHLVAGADVMFTADLAERLAARGLDPAELCAAYPRLVHVAITPYGTTGPYRDWAGEEITAYAMGGYLYFGGEPEREPLMVPGFQAAHHAGMQAALAALVGLAERDRSGLGQQVDVSHIEAMLSAHSWTSVAWTHEGQVLGRVPTDLIPCADGWVFFMLTNLEGVLLLTERTDLLDDARFSTIAARMENREALQAIVAEWCAPRTMAEIYQAGQELRVAVTPVHTVRDLAASPQLQARGWFRAVEHPRAGRIHLPGPPYHLTATPAVVARPAPLLDEHGAKVRRHGWDAPAGSNGRGTRNDQANAGPLPAPPIIARSSLPLAGLRILELTANWAGPLAGRYLADLGAEVIKVEAPRRPATRALHPAGNDPRTRPYNRSGYFNKLNRNKQGLVLDLASERGRELFLRLVRRADVVIENNSVRVLHNLRLTYDVLRTEKPDIILCSMSGFGGTGPERDFVAYGSNIETVCGLAALMAYPGDPTPHRTGSYYADPVAGAHGAIAILAALRHRDRTGEGQWIDLSLLESAAALFGEALMEWELNRRLPAPLGNRDPRHAPQGVYRCAGVDSWLALTVRTEQEWRGLCRVIPTLADRPGWGIADGRRASHDAIDAAVTAWSSMLDHYEAARILQAAGVPAAPVLANWELLSDPHIHARDFYVPVPHPEVGVLPFPGMPWRFSRTPGSVRSGAPCFGEHNREVLSGVLGLTEDEITELYAKEITSDVPLLLQ